MPRRDQKDEASSQLWRASGLGGEFAAGIIGMIALGWLVDRWLDSKPTGMIVGAALGMVGGGYNFIRQAQRMNRDAQAAYRRSNPGPKKAPTTESDTKPDANKDDHGDR